MNAEHRLAVLIRWGIAKAEDRLSPEDRANPILLAMIGARGYREGTRLYHEPAPPLGYRNRVMAQYLNVPALLVRRVVEESDRRKSPVNKILRELDPPVWQRALRFLLDAGTELLRHLSPRHLARTIP